MVDPLVLDHDITILTETKLQRSHPPPEFPGFRSFNLSASSRKKTQTGPCSGGILVYVRDGVFSDASIWSSPTPSKNLLWVKLDRVNQPSIYVCAVYIPPTSSKAEYRDEEWSSALADALDAIAVESHGTGIPLLGGDFNAHTGTDSELDDVDGLLVDLERVTAGVAPLEGEPEAPTPGLPLDPLADAAVTGPTDRRNPDTTPIDARGRDLLRFCRTSTFAILNGRAQSGNSGGTRTCLKGDRNSVVDYFLCPVALLPAARSLEVLLEDGALSREYARTFDHHRLSLTLDIPVSGPPVTPTHEPIASALVPKVRFRLPRDESQLAVLATDLQVRLQKLPTGLSMLPVTEHTQALLSSLVDGLTEAGCRHVRRPPRPDRHPWYNQELIKACDRVRILARSGSGASLPALREARRHYRRLLESTRKAWHLKQARRFVGLATSAPTRFWASLRKRQQVTPRCSSSVVAPYYQRLLNPTVAPIDPATLATAPVISPAQQAVLNNLALPFTVEEISASLASMKDGKSADAAGLSAEVLKLAFAAPTVPLLVALLNRFREEGFPSDSGLESSVLVPIYKGSGDTSDLNNFRGVSILPVLTKLYAIALERRLSAVLEKTGLRADSQFGFRKRRGTAEAAFVLQALIETRHLKGPRRKKHTPKPVGPQGHRLFCFVDFRKAFDTVQRDVLWQLMLNLGIPEPFVQAIASYYKVVSCCVDLPSGLSDPVTASIGVKQGCPLSPVLFGIFIESLLRSVVAGEPDSPDPAFPRLGPTPVPPLLYADDLTLVATSLAGLQEQCRRLERAASRFGLSINTAKTKALAVGMRDASRRALRLVLAGQTVEWVQEFRFLGLTLHSSRHFVRAAETLEASASLRHMDMWRRARELGIEDPDSLCTMFDSLVNSILGYGISVWGPAVFAASGVSKEPGASSNALSIERLHRRFLKTLLGLPRAAPTSLVMLESGRPPLVVGYFRTTVKFLRRLMDVAVHPPTSLLGAALRASAQAWRQNEDCWIQRMVLWAQNMGAPLDLTSLLPPEARRVPVVRSQGTGPVPRLHTAPAAHMLALEAWSDKSSETVLEEPVAQSQLRREWLLARMRPRTPSPSGRVPASPWIRRRPVSAYKAFPLCRTRGPIARARIGMCLSWAGTDIPVDISPADKPARPPRPRHVALLKSCPCCSEGRLLSLEHVLSCPLPGPQTLRSAFGVPSDRLFTLLDHPPSLFPSFLYSFSAFALRVRNEGPTVLSRSYRAPTRS